MTTEGHTTSRALLSSPVKNSCTGRDVINIHLSLDACLSVYLLQNLTAYFTVQTLFNRMGIKSSNKLYFLVVMHKILSNRSQEDTNSALPNHQVG